MHYEKAGIYKRVGVIGGFSQALIEEFDEIEVVRVEGNVITVKVVFWWRIEDGGKAGVSSGVCTAKTDGKSYEVLKLETGGKTYGKGGTIIN